jgi:hypothetical protein
VVGFPCGSTVSEENFDDLGVSATHRLAVPLLSGALALLGVIIARSLGFDLSWLTDPSATATWPLVVAVVVALLPEAVGLVAHALGRGWVVDSQRRA